MTALVPLQSWGSELGVGYSSTLAIGFFIFYSILMVAIGIYASRYQDSEEDYFVAGRRGGMVVIALSVYAGLLSGFGVVGNTGTIYASNIQFFLILMFVPAFYVIPYWLLAKKMRMLGEFKDAITAADAVYYRFKDERLRVLAATSVLLGCIGYLATQYAALGMLMAFILPYGFVTSLVIGLIVVGLYTVIGGMLAAIWSDAIQGAIMVFAAALGSWYFITGYPGGWEGAMNTITTESPEYLAVGLPGTSQGLPIGLFISLFLLLVTLVGLPHAFTKFYMIKDGSRLKWGALITGIAYLVSTLFWFAAPIMKAAVLSGRVENIPTPDAALPLALIEFAPDFVVAFVMTGVIAAIMSSSNAYLNMGASAILHDVVQENQGYELSGNRQVFWGRIITVLILLASFVVAATFPGLIFTLGAAGWAIFATVLVPGVAIAWNWRGATVEGTLWGGGVGLALAIALAFGGNYAGITLPMGFLGGQLAQIVGFVVFVVVSLVTSTNDYYDLEDSKVKAIIDTGRMSASERESPSGVSADD
ncbi:Na+:solute symporter [halophilic archaeon]|nr:Na+:solute symporter [halophilic archaeon]